MAEHPELNLVKLIDTDFTDFTSDDDRLVLEYDSISRKMASGTRIFGEDSSIYPNTVSYTHLTLPTNREV